MKSGSEDFQRGAGRAVLVFPGPRQTRGPRLGGSLRAVSLSLETWRTEELPTLADQGLRVGINWTGPRLVGWDFTVSEVLNRPTHALEEDLG